METPEQGEASHSLSPPPGHSSGDLHPAFYAGLAGACMMVCKDRIRVRQPTHSNGFSLLRLLQEHYGGRLTHITGKGTMLFFNGAARKSAFSTMVDRDARDASVPGGNVEWARGYLCGAAKVTPAAVTVTGSPAIIPRLRAALLLQDGVVAEGDDTRLLVVDPASYKYVRGVWMTTPAPPATRSLEEANARVEVMVRGLVQEHAQALVIRTRAPLTAAQKTALSEVARASGWDELQAIVDTASSATGGETISLEQARQFLRRNALPPYAFLEPLPTPRRRARPMPDDIRACVVADLTAGLTPADVLAEMRRYLPSDYVPTLQTIRKLKISGAVAERRGVRGTMWLEVGQRYGQGAQQGTA